jgi:Ca2+-binding RTX toxin-like protein
MVYNNRKKIVSPFILSDINIDNKMHFIMIPLIAFITILAIMFVSPVYAGNVQLTMDNDRIINVPPTGTEATDQAFVIEETEDNTVTPGLSGDPIYGSEGANTIIGTPYDDLIYGRNAAENINGLTGNDIVFGKGGDDNIQGAQLDDKLYGEKGDDILMGSYENDYLSGGDGDDQLFGGDHDDTLRGGKGANLFNCGNGFDVVVDFDPQNGDVRTNDCEVVNVVNH